MDCPRCINPFGETHKIPRILPKCGHSYCSDCITELFSNSQLSCPQCGKLNNSDSPEDFPINQALLQIAISSSQLCSDHSRPFEAFCKDDHKLMCVRCLLEPHHRVHEVASIKEEAQNERERLLKISETVKNIEENISKNEKELKDCEFLINSECEKLLKDYKDLYDMVRGEINKRETETITQIKNILNKEQGLIEEKEFQYKKQVYLLQTLKQEIEKVQAEKDLEVLSKVTEREAVIKSACSEINAITKNKPYSEYSKDNEKKILGKIICDVLDFSEKEINYQTIIKPKSEVTDNDSTITKTTQIIKSYAYPFNTEQKFKSKAQTMKITTQSRFIRDKSPVTIRSSMDTKSGWNTRREYNRISLDFSPENVQIEPFSAKNIFEDDLSSVHSLDLASFCKIPKSIIYNIGGFSESTASKVEMFDLSNENWKEIGDYHSARTQFAAVQYQNKIIALGGKIKSKAVDTCEEFDRENILWRTSDIFLAGARSGFGATVISSKKYIDDLYVIGGSDGVPIKTAEMYSGDRWITVNSLKLRRDELSVSLGPDNNIYAIGGYGGPDMTSQSSAERFSIKEGIWSFMPHMKEARRALASVTLPDGVYVFGGFDGLRYLNTMEKFDIRAGKWMQLAPMNTARCSLSGVASSDCQYIYAIGGFNGIGVRSVERYSVVENSWQEINVLCYPRFSHCSLMFNE